MWNAACCRAPALIKLRQNKIRVPGAIRMNEIKKPPEKPAEKLPSSAVSEQRLWQRHVDMAKIGATPKGGVNRQALSSEDIKARALLAEWTQKRGFELSVDDIGNIFIRR